jgi:putative ATP-dependent endonuclease of the OLD family
MKLSTISIQNYRSIKSLEFDFPESGILFLVGPNNAGKSNIIRAIDLVCGDNWASKEKLEDYDRYGRAGARVCIDLHFDNERRAKWGDDYGKWGEYLGPRGRMPYESKIKDDYPCTYLGADRNFDKQMSFYDWTLLGRIRKQFHRQARVHEAELKQKYAELVAVFNKVDNFTRFKDDFIGFFNDMQADTSAKLAVAFEPFTPANYFKTLQILATDPEQSDLPLDLDELGEGSRNMVLLSLLRSYAKNFRAPDQATGLLAIDEPETFLHPQARRHLAKVLRDIASSGMQVIVTTHSTSFIDTEYFDSIGRVIKIEDDEAPGRKHTQLISVSPQDLVEHCVATGVPADKTTVISIRDFYKTTSNAVLNEAFFARAVVLVEGETEELALPIYLEALGIDCDLLGISIVRVSGKNQLPKYWRLFSAFEVPLIVMLDNDNSQDEQTNKNIAICFGIQLEEFIKNVDTVKRIVAQRPAKTPLLVLEKDFETSIAKSIARLLPNGTELVNQWEAEARVAIKPIRNQQKGAIARFVARRFRAHSPDLVPSLVDELASCLRALGVCKVSVPTNQVVAEKDEDDDLPF